MSRKLINQNLQRELEDLTTAGKQTLEDVRCRIEDSLFDEQLDFVNDDSDFKIAVCTRRAGKSSSMVRQLAMAAIDNPRSTVVYLALEQRSVRDLGFDPFKNMIRDLDIGPETLTYVEGTMRVTFTNGSKIIFLGADHDRVIETLRGLAFSLCVIDEGGSWKSDRLRYFIYRVMAPALADHGGQISVIGTPPEIPDSFLEFAFGNGEWSSHSWSWKDNPFVPDDNAEKIIDATCSAEGIDRGHHSIRREWYGEFVYDTDGLAYELDEKCLVTTLPNLTEYAMGIDFGWHDHNAISILGWNNESDKVYIVETFKAKHLPLAEFSKKIGELKTKYKIAFTRTAADTGGGGKAIVEDLAYRDSLHLQAADKKDKAVSVSRVNTAFRTRKLLIYAPNAKDFYDEARALVKCPKNPLLHKDGNDHLTDTVLYGYRLTKAFHFIGGANVVIDEGTRRKQALISRHKAEQKKKRRDPNSWLR